LDRKIEKDKERNAKRKARRGRFIAPGEAYSSDEGDDDDDDDESIPSSELSRNSTSTSSSSDHSGKAAAEAQAKHLEEVVRLDPPNFDPNDDSTIDSELEYDEHAGGGQSAAEEALPDVAFDTIRDYVRERRKGGDENDDSDGASYADQSYDEDGEAHVRRPYRPAVAAGAMLEGLPTTYQTNSPHGGATSRAAAGGRGGQKQTAVARVAHGDWSEVNWGATSVSRLAAEEDDEHRYDEMLEFYSDTRPDSKGSVLSKSGIDFSYESGDGNSTGSTHSAHARSREQRATSS
jgi:hypothetical protein